MAAEGNPVCGGVMLLHTECEGKHSYEVNGFFNYNKGKFASKGDKLIMINNTDVEGLTPQAFAELLAEGSPLLTIHHSPKRKTEECKSEEINVHEKELTVMKFSMMMVREEELEATGVQLSPEWENTDIEDDCISDDKLLLVSMADTSFSVVVARGCDPDSPCNSCGGMNCEFNEVVVLPVTAEITFNSSRILIQIREQNNVILKSFLMEKYVTPKNQHMFLKDTMSAKITLYYYTTVTMDREGVPVVLNFSGTENFFCCTTKQGEDKKILTVMSHNKKDLKSICPDDPEKWSLVFYMSCGRDDLRRFESALYRGWFIYTQSVDSREVDMREDRLDSKQDGAFSFIILSGSC